MQDMMAAGKIPVFQNLKAWFSSSVPHQAKDSWSEFCFYFGNSVNTNVVSCIIYCTTPIVLTLYIQHLFTIISN